MDGSYRADGWHLQVGDGGKHSEKGAQSQVTTLSTPISLYIIFTESHDQGLSNKPIYILRNTLVHEIHVEQAKCSKHLKHFGGTVGTAM